MPSLGVWILGAAAYATDTVVWPNGGGVVTLIISGALLLSVAGLVMARERVRSVTAPTRRWRDFDRRDGRLPTAA